VETKCEVTFWKKAKPKGALLGVAFSPSQNG